MMDGPSSAWRQHVDVHSSPRRATLDVQLVCRETTKYPGMGVLHNFRRGDIDFRCA
jgi:hypothetical protein